MREGVSLLSWLLERWLAWQEEKTEIVMWINSVLQDYVNQGKSIDELLEEDPSAIDTSLYFDLRHPYPAILTIVHRLHQLGVITNRTNRRKVNQIAARSSGKKLLKCEAWPAGFDASDDEWQVVRYNAQVTIYDAESNYESWPNPNALYSSSQQVRMRWALPIGWCARDNLSPAPKSCGEIEYLDWIKKRASSLWPCNLPGASSFTIADGLAEYLVLKDVEQWVLLRFAE